MDLSKKKLIWLKLQGIDQIFSSQTINRFETNSNLIKQENIMPIIKNYDIESLSSLPPQEIAKIARAKVEECSNLAELESLIKKYDWCAIKKTATNTVFGDGVKESNIMLLGEAPGANEDMQGIPFCGESGKLLDDILKYVNLSRQKNIYITNTIFWRPPGNRKPTNDEIAICTPFVEKNIALFNPKLIILVGSTACSCLLDQKEGITKIRGKFYQYKNPYLDHQIPITAIFHPSYLLRQPSQKKYVWNDLLFIKNYIDENNLL